MPSKFINDDVELYYNKKNVFTFFKTLNRDFIGQYEELDKLFSKLFSNIKIKNYLEQILGKNYKLHTCLLRKADNYSNYMGLHTDNNFACYGAISLGASIIEKHFTDMYSGAEALPRLSKEIINDPKYEGWTKKDFRGEGKLNNVKEGGVKILTRKETERANLKFPFAGKRRFKDPNLANIIRDKKIRETQGSNISIKGSGQTGTQFSHVYPLIKSAKPGTKTTFKIPVICIQIFKGMLWADHIHLRCPGNIALLGCFIQILFPFKPKTIIYKDGRIINTA